MGEHIKDSIRFTMEQEVNGSFPFLDVLISKKDDSSSSHKFFRNKTHVEKYLHANFHHYPAKKLGVLNTLSTPALEFMIKVTFIMC